MINGGSPNVDQSSRVEHVPQVNPIVDKFFIEKHPLKIAQTNYTKPYNNLSNDNINLSTLLSEVLEPYVSGKIQESAKEIEELENSKTYQNTISSLNNFIIMNPNIPPEKINILLQLIKDEDELNKIIEQIQNKKNGNKRRGGTRKKRY
jgi:hypothetical protein